MMLLASLKSFGTIVTVAPLASVANTFPPGFSRMNAPPPSEALMSPMMGVGSAVTVEVAVSVDFSVALGVMGAGVDVSDGVRVGTPIIAVAAGTVGDNVIVGNGVGMDKVWVIGAGLGVARPACILIH